MSVARQKSFRGISKVDCRIIFFIFFLETLTIFTFVMENSLTSKRIKQTDWFLEFQEKPDKTLNSLALQLISLLTLIFIS